MNNDENIREDIFEYINEYYHNGINKRFMKHIINEIKMAFTDVDESLIIECVKLNIA